MLGKKIPTLLGIVLLVLVGAGLWLYQKSQIDVISDNIVPTEVKITNISDNKFSVSWQTENPTLGRVEYGSVGEKLDKQKGDDRGESFVGKTHHITVSDLQPGTQYAFRLMSGEKLKRFDNNGSVYSVSTGRTLTNIPAARSLYGEVSGANTDTIVYITLPDSQPTSVTLTSNNTYSVSLSTIRNASLSDYVVYDPAATIITMSLVGTDKRSLVTVSTANIAPVPAISLGENADYRMKAIGEESEQVAQIETIPNATEAQTPTIFNVEPLSEAEINAVSSTTYSLLNPAVEGEVLSTTRPEFRGTGVSNAEISVMVSGQKTVSDVIRVGSSGSWTWTPAIALSLGKQKITLTFKDKDDKTQIIERGFSITNTTTTSEPAFVSTPSGTTGSGSVSSSPTSSPRVTLPSTESGVPDTGVVTPTLLTLALGFAIMVIGGVLLAL